MIKLPCRLPLIAICFIFTFLNPAWAVQVDGQAAAETVVSLEKEPLMPFTGIELLSGFAWNKLKAKSVFDKKPDYRFVPFIVDLDFNLKNLTKRIGFNPPSLINLQIEPYLAYVWDPSSNMEVGNSFFLKFGLVPENWKFQPFVKAGVGMVYMTQHTQEQSTQFNFIETGAVGAHYFFKPNLSLVSEFRLRHLSNAGIDHPNSGINTYLGVIGISYKY